MKSKYALRFVALGYLALLLGIPVVLVFINAFQDGVGAAWDAVTTPEAQHAFWLTFIMVIVAVPLNTIFGVLCALAVVRQRFRGRAVLNALVDLPFAVSPVVVGLALLLVYGRRDGWIGPWLADHGVQVIFSTPGMILATMFVSLPFVVREVIPVLREIGTEQEQAAATLGAGGLADVLPHHAAGDPLGRGLRRGPDHCARARRVRRGERRVRQAVRADGDRDAVRREPLPAASTRPGPMLPRWCWRCWPWLRCWR